MVAATDMKDKRAWFSNFGVEVDVAAPGVAVYSTNWNDTYRYASGTSASAPFVSGLAGLLLSQDPTLSPDEIEVQIKATCDDVNSDTYPGEDIYLGAGRINAYQALSKLPVALPEVIHATVKYEYDRNGNQIKRIVTTYKKEKEKREITTYEYDFVNHSRRKKGQIYFLLTEELNL